MATLLNLTAGLHTSAPERSDGMERAKADPQNPGQTIRTRGPALPRAVERTGAKASSSTAGRPRSRSAESLTREGAAAPAAARCMTPHPPPGQRAWGRG